VNRSLVLAEQSDEATLPYGWESHKTNEGREFYVNLRSAITQWTVPRLPPHWEERLSSDGRIYYLSLFDGRTQWDWPAENGNMLTLPGSTQAMPQAIGFDMMSEASTGTGLSIGNAVDQVDAGVLLCIAPERPDDLMSTPATTPGTTPRSAARSNVAPAPGALPQKDPIKKLENQRPWGQSQADKDWLELRRKLVAQKRAHEMRHQKAKEFPGIREFARPHEMTDMVNNWDKQLHNVNEKLDLMDRKKAPLGVRAELEKEELRNVFPIIQRLLWTKWSTFEIFVHAYMRAGPTTSIYLNVSKPTKFQRCLLYFLFVSISLLGCCMMVFFEAPVDEDIEAIDRAVWTLVGEVFTMPFDSNLIWVVIFSDLFGRAVQAFCHSIFFSYQVPTSRPPIFGQDGRLSYLRYWHELAECGKWVVTLIIVVSLVTAFSLCATFAQPRSSAVARAFLIEELWSFLLLPFTRALGTTLCLNIAKGGPMCDGILTNFPGIMDFLPSYVKTTEFLAWRVERIVSEAEVLRRVHREPPEIGGAVDPSRDDADGGDIVTNFQNPSMLALQG